MAIHARERIVSHAGLYEKIKGNSINAMQFFAKQGGDGPRLRPIEAWGAIYGFFEASTALTPPEERPEWLAPALNLIRDIRWEYKTYDRFFHAVVDLPTYYPNLEKGAERMRRYREAMPDDEMSETAAMQLINLDHDTNYAITQYMRDAVGEDYADGFERNWMWLKKAVFFGEGHPKIEIHNHVRNP